MPHPTRSPLPPPPLRRLALTAGLVTLISGACTQWSLDLVDYTPQERGDWTTSTPEAEGLDDALISELFFNAAKVKSLHALLVIKNGRLIAEGYFGEGGIDQATRIQSVTKSMTSALVGIAIDRGCLTGVDQHMMDFFPEFADEITDPRKFDITVEDMLQMRAGYLWEESDPALFDALYDGFRSHYLVDFPLTDAPGEAFQYSNLTAHLLGIIVARACETDLKTFAETHLFEPLDIHLVDWITDWEGNYNGHGDIHINARDMAKFGQLYLDGGVHDGAQIVPSSWVENSLQIYSEDATTYRVGRHFKDVGYGYQWWTARAGEHNYHLAWGHGGQQIAILDTHDLVVVVKSDPQFADHGGSSWRQEKANLRLVGNFINRLPAP